MRPSFDVLDLPYQLVEPVHLFLDTEFTDLGMSADLLSLGLVARDVEAELYIEIADAAREMSSTFVLDEVLPLFGKHNPQILRRAAAAARIEEWLDDLRDGNRETPIVLLSNYSGDWTHVLDLFAGMPGELPWPRQFNISGQMLQSRLVSPAQHVAFDEAELAYFRRHGDRHHALVDARATKFAWFESRFAR